MKFVERVCLANFNKILECQIARFNYISTYVLNNDVKLIVLV